MKVIFLVYMATFLCTVEKTYTKLYYSNGQLKEEGWQKGNNRVDYWYFYFENGKVMEEGSYDNNIKTDYWKIYNIDGTKKSEGRFKNRAAKGWWIFYKNNEVIQKTEYSEGQKNGYSLFYTKGTITKVEKYKANTKTGEWNDYESFKRDNW
jgi:antitoxin component YwqK of YwqJK toxin-antitoxin module